MESKEKSVAIFIPRKRNDLTEQLDKINALENAITFKLEIEKQIELNLKKIALLESFPLLDKIRKVFLSNRVNLERVNRSIELSKIRTSNQNNEKMKYKFHANELSLEDDLEEIYSELNERFDAYCNALKDIHDQYRFGKTPPKDLPMKDVSFLLSKYNAEPPKTKTDKLAFYLTLEELLYRCSKA